MSSAKKRAANRANARKSTGPRTQAGKEASRRNSLVHGLSAEVLLLDHEDPAEFEGLRDALVADYAPASVLECEFVDRLVSIVWRMRRVPVLERELIAWMDHRQHAVHDAAGKKATSQSANGGKDAARGLSLASGQLSDAGLRRLRRGRALEALLEKNLIGKLDDHEARLMRQLRIVLVWLDDQLAARAMSQIERGTEPVIDVTPLPEAPASSEAPPVPAVTDGGTAPPVVPVGAPAISSAWLADASARGQYVPPSLREALKLQQAQGKGGSANTPG
jgi:hypothetical protein